MSFSVVDGICPEAQPVDPRPAIWEFGFAVMVYKDRYVVFAENEG